MGEQIAPFGNFYLSKDPDSGYLKIFDKNFTVRLDHWLHRFFVEKPVEKICYFTQKDGSHRLAVNTKGINEFNVEINQIFVIDIEF